ncbi:hypothetical protein TDB9533_01077 [Thalassocella blandensis]|nr:hypothetical protein TDB9533_01077 [Thalassocella blandensis]
MLTMFSLKGTLENMWNYRFVIQITTRLTKSAIEKFYAVEKFHIEIEARNFHWERSQTTRFRFYNNIHKKAS